MKNEMPFDDNIPKTKYQRNTQERMKVKLTANKMSSFGKKTAFPNTNIMSEGIIAKIMIANVPSIFAILLPLGEKKNAAFLNVIFILFWF